MQWVPGDHRLGFVETNTENLETYLVIDVHERLPPELDDVIEPAIGHTIRVLVAKRRFLPCVRDRVPTDGGWREGNG